VRWARARGGGALRAREAAALRAREAAVLQAEAGGEGGGGSGASVRQPDGVVVAPRAQKMAKSRSVEPIGEEEGA
jgi:hypothetical protein